MSRYSLSHVRGGELLRNLKTLVAKERATTAEVLAHIAEVDTRRLYLPAAHPSMHSYCVHELGLSEEAAYKRIHAARAAREFPAIFEAVADGRLHLGAVILLAPRLTQETVVELLTAAAGKTKSEIEQLLAERFPRPDVPERLEAIVSAEAVTPLNQLSTPIVVGQHAPGRVETSPAFPKVAPLSLQGFALQMTIEQSTHEKLRYAQALLGHRVPGRDIAQVFDRALDALIARLEKQKFGATSLPRPPRVRSSNSPRYIPLCIRREVWERDGGQCTYVSEASQRCPERSGLEFDHVLEVACGGGSSEAEIRLRCRAHNQYGAECTFGREFMNGKRALARGRVAARRTERESARTAREAETARAQAAAEEIVPALRELGFRADESRSAAVYVRANPPASLEDRVKLALSYLCPKRPSPTALSASPAGRRLA